MISRIPSREEETKLRELLRQGKLAPGTKITSGYIINNGVSESDYPSDNELIIDKYGCYQGLR